MPGFEEFTIMPSCASLNVTSWSWRYFTMDIWPGALYWPLGTYDLVPVFRLKILTGKFHPYSSAAMDETPEKLMRRRLGYFETAVLKDEAEFGPVNARRRQT